MEKEMFWVVLLLPMLGNCCCWGECPPHEISALNNFKQALDDPRGWLASWRGVYCCSWWGITCHTHTSHVIRMDLRIDEEIYSGLRIEMNSSSQIFSALFLLQHLEYLHLNNIDLSPLPIPSHLPSLNKLKHLNLMYCGLTGPIPSELGNMSSLKFLDISHNYNLEMRQSGSWIRNLRGLEHLGLAGLNLTLGVVENIASLPNLMSLHMSKQSGTLLSPLVNLTSLSHLDLSDSNFTQKPFPIWISNLTSLVSLDLTDCSLHGSIPSAVLSLPQLRQLRLSYNYDLKVNLSLLVQHASQLSTLSIEHSSVGGVIPKSIGSMSSLTYLDLSGNHIEGSLPNSMGNVSSLTYLDLSSNNIEGSLPNFLGNMSLLTYLDLSSNNIEDSLPNSMGNMSLLTYLDLSSNNIEGSLPNSMGNMSSLRFLYLFNNALRGNIPCTLGRLSKLAYLDFQSNQLNGSLPSTFGKLSSLVELNLKNNSLSGTFLLSQLENFTKLIYLDLSDNFLRVKVEGSWIPKFQLEYLYLSSCNMDGDFPAFISTQYTIWALDLSNNSLSGNIPDWLWDLALSYKLNLSCNQFGGRPLSFKFSKLSVRYVDLHRNKLQGTIFGPHPNVELLDMSENQFDGIIPPNIDKYSQGVLEYLSLANNNISGTFPHSICAGLNLHILDVSNNKLTGNFSASFRNCSSTLQVLNLEHNNLEGDISSITCLENHFQSLKLGGNKIQGPIPSSLKNCTSLEVLDLGYNNMQGTIPNWIGNLIDLQVLVLRTNNFKGGIPLQLTKLQNLHVLILSNNNLFGAIPSSLRNLRAMANQTQIADVLQYSYLDAPYLEKMKINNKGQFLEYERFLALVRCLDLSNNNFSGDIPQDIGFLIGLRILNLSGDHLSGRIPTSFGNLVQLESLDVARNNLIGNIPGELQNLTFLSYLNISCNSFSGRIPQGGQLLTFDERSFSNNGDLCGLQINKSCSSSPSSNNTYDEDISEQEWEEHVWWEVGVGLSIGFGFSIVIGVLCFNKKCRTRCFKVMDDIIVILDQTVRENIF